MIQNRDFIITGLQPWDIEIGSNAKNIAMEIARYNRVLYVNTPLDQLTLLRGIKNSEFIQRKEVLQGKKQPLREITKNLWVLDFPFTIYSINKIPWNNIFNYLNLKNNQKMHNYLNEIIRKMNFKQIIHINDNDIYRSFYFKEMIAPTLSIYYRRDNLLSVDFWKRHGSRLEPLLVAKSDLVLTNSLQLADAVKAYNPNTYDIGQGVDLTDFDLNRNYPKPKDLKDIKGPIIGYAGFLTSLRLDIELIVEIARHYPKYNIVLVGPEDEIFSQHPIHQIPNIYFLGNKPNEEVASYMANFDICINPQLVNETTIGNYPRKVDEYLALGKLIIATNTPTMQLFKEYVYLCNTQKEYIQAIDIAINKLQNDLQKTARAKFAKEHTWENSVEKIYKHIHTKEKC